MSSPAATATTGRRRVAILEDDHSVRRSMQLLLHANAYDVKAYASANSLLSDPDVDDAACLIIDYLLDRTDGIAVLRQLRERGWRGPAILVTAFGSTELAERAMAAGFCEILEKPCKERELINAVAKSIRAMESLAPRGSRSSQVP